MTRQLIVIDDLPPDKPVTVELRAIGPDGAAGPWVKASGRASPALPEPPKLALAGPERTPGEPPTRSNALRAWAFPEGVRGDPTAPAPELRKSNAIWSGADGTIHVSAAQGEVVAFQLCVEAVRDPLADVRIMCGDLVHSRGNRVRAIPSRHVGLFRVWSVKAGGAWHGEYAVPVEKGGVGIPWAQNKIPGQKNQSFQLDVFVPKDAAPGRYTGAIGVSARGVPAFHLPIKLTVHGFALPDVMSFYAELNCYGGPGRAGSEKFRESHRLAHAHRCTINRVPYNQAGDAHDDLVPPVKGSGAAQRVADWTAFDRDAGPLLDGSLFKGLPRDGVPVNVFYLPHHENWPNRLADHFRYRGKPHGKGIILPFALQAPPPQAAFSKAFQAGFVAVARDFALHAKERGWTRTTFQCYQNNKWLWRVRSRGTSWWLLDEPAYFDDWEALGFFGGLFHRAVRGIQGVRFVCRGDISRPQWQRNWMNGLMGVMYISRQLYERPRRCEIMRREMPCTQILYGSCGKVEDPLLVTRRWCLESYLLGADGVLPWQSLAGDGAFDRPDRNGLIVDGAKRFGVPAIASLRVKALRRGVQDVEYLIALARKRRWTREQVRALLTGSGACANAVDRVRRWTAADFAAARSTVARAIVSE